MNLSALKTTYAPSSAPPSVRSPRLPRGGKVRCQTDGSPAQPPINEARKAQALVVSTAKALEKPATQRALFFGDACASDAEFLVNGKSKQTSGQFLAAGNLEVSNVVIEEVRAEGTDAFANMVLDVTRRSWFRPPTTETMRAILYIGLDEADRIKSLEIGWVRPYTAEPAADESVQPVLRSLAVTEKKMLSDHFIAGVSAQTIYPMLARMDEIDGRYTDDVRFLDPQNDDRGRNQFKEGVEKTENNGFIMDAVPTSNIIVDDSSAFGRLEFKARKQIGPVAVGVDISALSFMQFKVGEAGPRTFRQMDGWAMTTFSLHLSPWRNR